VSIETGLVSMLSSVAGGRVFPRVTQNTEFPAIRYQRITTTRTLAIDGPVGVTEATIQVDCMARTYADAKATADEVRGLLHGYRGAWGTLIARLVSLQSENDFYEQDGDRITHWVSQRYAVYTNAD
jgi:hypothetical protein